MAATSTGPTQTPLQIGSLTVAGRLFKSAMSATRSRDDGFVTDALLQVLPNRPYTAGKQADNVVAVNP